MWWGQSVFDSGRRQTHRLTPLNFVELEEPLLFAKLSELCVSQRRVCVSIVWDLCDQVVICVIKSCDLWDPKLWLNEVTEMVFFHSSAGIVNCPYGGVGAIVQCRLVNIHGVWSHDLFCVLIGRGASCAHELLMTMWSHHPAAHFDWFKTWESCTFFCLPWFNKVEPLYSHPGRFWSWLIYIWRRGTT